MDLGLILLLSVAALAFIMIGSSAYFSFFMKRMVFRHLSDLDHIRDTGLAPERWRERAKARKLKALIKFVKRTRMVEDDQVREGVLRDLSAIRRSWEGE
jgi:hypothetical protein